MSAMGIVLPAFFSNSHRIEDCHATLIYLGEFGSVHVDRKAVELANERLRSQVTPAMIKVTGVEVFGKGNMTVLILDDFVLKSYRHFIDRELARDGIRSASEYAYRPHVTINKHTVSSEPILPWPDFKVPTYVWVDRPQVWWNGER